MTLAILLLEDEPEVRNALERDLQEFSEFVRIEPAEDVTDAWAVIDDLEAAGDALALALCDHRLPGESGVDFLIQMMTDERTVNTRKVLVTGQADLSDTIRAVNEAGLDHYLEKPWRVEELHVIVRAMVADFIAREELNPLPYLGMLEAERGMKLVRDLGRAD